jgi:hypothetical protein
MVMVDESTFNTIAVSTADSKEAILAANNSAAWTLNFEKWHSKLRYLVCLQKEGRQRRAFLVCKISAVRLRPDPRDPRPRYIIEFDEYAEPPADTPLIAGSQYPVRFGRPETFKVKLGELSFQKAPRKTLDYSYSARAPAAREEAGITISEAKRLLAIGLGVREDQIEITIRT